MSFKTTATIASFGGKLLKLTHDAKTTGCQMALNLYLPPNSEKSGQQVPVLFYLSGLTCTGDNCAEKGFFQHGASQKGIAIVYPDTSPRTSPQFTPPSPITDAGRRRAQHPRRRRILGFWHRRGILYRCDSFPMVSELQDGVIHHLRTPRSSLRLLPKSRQQARFYHRT